MTSSRVVVDRGGGTLVRRSTLRRAVRSGVFRAAKAAFAAADLFLGPWPGPRILIYHQVGAGSGRQMDLDPHVFRGHVEWLMRNGRIVGLGDALSEADDPGSERRYVLTFDDGYADVFENAFPLLRDLGVPFTLYLTTGHIESGQPLHPGDRPLTWDQVGEMIESGLVTVGAHTHTHPDLRGMPVDRIAEEVEHSNRLIQLRTGHVPRHFAYPKGLWDEGAETVVRANYATAVLGAGPPVTGATDPHRIPRVAVQQADGQVFFRRKIARGMRMEERVRSRVKGYRNPYEAGGDS